MQRTKPVACGRGHERYAGLRDAHLFDGDEDRMLTVMDDAMKAWSGAGRYSVEPGGYQEWCDYVGDLELLVSRAYAAASENDVVTVRYLGIGTDPHEVEGGRIVSNDNAKRKSVLGANDGLNESVRNWAYSGALPDGEEEFFADAPADVTFGDVWEAVQRGDDVYEVMGVGDSVSREYVFDQLSVILGVDYDYVYNKWLHPDKTSKRTKRKGASGAKRVAQSSVATFEDINYFLSEAADACAELEDYYFGEPVVDCLNEAYDHCEAAIDEIVRASMLVSE